MIRIAIVKLLDVPQRIAIRVDLLVDAVQFERVGHAHFFLFDGREPLLKHLDRGRLDGRADGFRKMVGAHVVDHLALLIEVAEAVPRGVRAAQDHLVALANHVLLQTPRQPRLAVRDVVGKPFEKNLHHALGVGLFAIGGVVGEVVGDSHAVVIVGGGRRTLSGSFDDGLRLLQLASQEMVLGLELFNLRFLFQYLLFMFLLLREQLLIKVLMRSIQYTTSLVLLQIDAMNGCVLTNRTTSKQVVFLIGFFAMVMYTMEMRLKSVLGR